MQILSWIYVIMTFIEPSNRYDSQIENNNVIITFIIELIIITFLF